MILLFSLMVAGYALGAAATVLSPTDGAARRAAAADAVIGGGAGLAVALGFFAGGAPLVVEAPALLSVADGLVFRLDALGAFYFVQSIEYRSEFVPWFERYLYAPLIARVTRWAAHARAIQSGSAHAYLTYLVIALLGLLAMHLVRGV